MPIFDYHCAKCDMVFEKLLMPGDCAAVACPDCSGAVDQIASAPALHKTSSRNGVLRREYKAYRKQWSESAYMPRPGKKSKD